MAAAAAGKDLSYVQRADRVDEDQIVGSELKVLLSSGSFASSDETVL